MASFVVMKRFLFISLFLFAGTTISFAQSNFRAFLGIQPSITIEPFYEDGELDVNILPIVLEFPIGNRVDFRILPLMNYHFGGEEQGLSDVGFFTVLPIFFKSQEESRYPFGFYAGPVLGLGRNLINDHYTTTLAVEPGYFFETKKRFSISLGLQLGSSFFAYDAKPNKWVFHWGPKVSFGFWLGDSTE